MPGSPARSHPPVPPLPPLPSSGFCCSRRISQEPAPANGIPSSAAWIPWDHPRGPPANPSGSVTELAQHTGCLVRPGQLHRPQSPGPWPECSLGQGQHGSHVTCVADIRHPQPTVPRLTSLVPEDSFLGPGLDEKLPARFQPKVCTKIQRGAQWVLQGHFYAMK